MTTIKFRAWTGSRMITPACIGEFGEWYETGRDYENGRSDKEGLMQYTGLKDKNGKEIYEGDILKYILTDVMPEDEGTEYTEEVIFEEGCFNVGGHVPVGVTCDWQCEVIGNRYENPDLLKD